MIGAITYTYDANKNMLTSLEESWSNGQWAGVYRYTYTYDASGNMLTELDEGWSNASSWLYTWTYNASGNRLSGLSEQWLNGQWVNGGRATWTYDADGRETSFLSEGWSNGRWVNGYRDTHTYDAQENLTSIWFYTWLNSSWTPRDYLDPKGRPFFVGIDSAANGYYLGHGYNYAFTRKLIVTSVASQSVSVPASYSLSQNYPNPFNPSTKIGFGVSGLGSSWVRLVVCDMLGREVSVLVNERKEPGNYTVQFNAGGLASGVYFYRIEAGSFVETRKLILLR